jgi:hypothetical protein
MPSDPRDEIAELAREQHKLLTRENQETAFARRILSRFAPQLSIPKVLKDLGKLVLSLDILPQLLENVPMGLAADSVRYLDRIAASDLLGGKLPNTPLWQAYVAAVERRGIDLRRNFFGLITPWTGATAVVLHNWPREDEHVDTSASYGRFVLVSCKHSASPMFYSLEPLKTLLDAFERAGVCARPLDR